MRGLKYIYHKGKKYSPPTKRQCYPNRVSRIHTQFYLFYFVLNKDALAVMVYTELYAQSLRPAAKVKGSSEGLKAKAGSFSYIQ